MARLIDIDDPGAADAAVAVLRAGGTVVLPTETVYGVATMVRNVAGVGRIFELKERPAGLHLAVLVADVAAVAELSADDREGPRRVMAAFWPGPLTVVLPRASSDLAHLGNPDATVGVRCPDHALARAIAAAVGPIATTSANRHGHPTPPTGAAVAEELPGADLVVEAGVSGGGVASTVVGLTGATPVLLREGPIPFDDVVAAWSRP